MSQGTPKRVPLASCLQLVNEFPWLPIGLFAGTEMMPNVKPITPKPAEPSPETSPNGYMEVAPLAGRSSFPVVEISPNSNPFEECG